uniref:Large ribosomal subunit protein uL16m n=1 Tax=Timema monikensis TaxID=170555 RepID=A0A7R9ECC3_9NEOP|nr:unnamed protein product [Timema monikensis]
MYIFNFKFSSCVSCVQATGGGRMRYGHFEMVRLGIGRKLDVNRMFALWRIDAPWQPVTKKGQGQRMGGGKGAIDHYVTPIKAGRVIVEIGGNCEFSEVSSNTIKQFLHPADKLRHVFPIREHSHEQPQLPPRLIWTDVQWTNYTATEHQATLPGVNKPQLHPNNSTKKTRQPRQRRQDGYDQKSKVCQPIVKDGREIFCEDCHYHRLGWEDEPRDLSGLFFRCPSCQQSTSSIASTPSYHFPPDCHLPTSMSKTLLPSLNALPHLVHDTNITVCGHTNQVQEKNNTLRGYTNPVCDANITVRGYPNPVCDTNLTVHGYPNPVQDANDTVRGYANPMREANNIVRGYTDSLCDANMMVRVGPRSFPPHLHKPHNPSYLLHGPLHSPMFSKPSMTSSPLYSVPMRTSLSIGLLGSHYRLCFPLPLGNSLFSHWTRPSDITTIDRVHLCFQVQPMLEMVAHKLPFKAEVVSQEIMEMKAEKELREERDNINPYTFKYVVQNNMGGCQNWISPYDRRWFGKHQ